MTELIANQPSENPTKNSSSLSTFARHYKVLMWKNFVLRRRRPVFLMAELLVPILFPIILLVIRSHATDVKQPTCYAQSISMPSMGLLTYVQSMLCNFQYRCQNTEPSRFKSIIDHKELIDALHEISLLVQDPWILQVFSTAVASRTDNSSIPNTQTVEKLQRVVQALSTIINGLSNIPEPSSSNDDSQTVHLFGFNISLATLDRIGNLSSTICSSPPEKNDIGQIAIWMKSLATNTSDIQTLFPRYVTSSLHSSLARHRRSVKPTSRTIRTKPAGALCTKLKHFLTISKIHKYTERLRFFLFGMVYYYPATTFTNEIMHRAAAPRRLLKRVHTVVRHYLDHTSPGLHRLLDSEMTTEIVQTLSRICDTLAFDGDNQTANQFCRKISPFLNDSIAHIKFLNEVDEWMLLFHEILSCSEPYLHLLPVHSEQEFQSLLVFFQQSTFPSAIGVNFSLVPSVDISNLRAPLDPAAQFFEVILRKIETTHQFRVFDRFWTPSPRQNPLSGDMNYLTGGFLDLQESISEAIIAVVSGRPDRLERTADVPSLFSDLVPGTELKLNPTPCYLNQGFITTFARILPQFLLFVWVFTAMLSTKYIVEEKEQRLKEFTRIMGLSTTIHWFGWFTITALIMMISVLAITLVLKFGNLIPAANYIMLLCFFLSYIVAVIALIFLCSTFFTQANLGAVVTGMVYFILFLPTPFLLTNEAVLTEAAVFGACLSCQVAFTMGLYYFMRIETQGFGAQWPDFWQTRHSNDVFSIGKCMLMLWVDTLIYMFFTWYIDAVHPGKYAVGRPLCFPFTREYWLGIISAPSASFADICSVNQESDAEAQQDPRYFEQEIDRQLSTGVGVFKITKRYKKKDKLALDQLTINFYANQITSLLGHNGAGKSTLISILTGMQAPTSGWARVVGYDIQRQLEQVRNHLGFCPQYNVLFDQLTVAEHIHFYASLRGIPNDQIKLEIEHLLDVLGFKDKRDCRSKTLSGGQKRKLSVAIAFVGNTSVVFLDEPTAGVDPFSRRSIWDLVMKLKTGRTIILTTHHMDEADILGDRIAIISQGRLKCYGSSLFLKANHGQGYHLILQRDSPGDQMVSSTASGFNPDDVLEYVRRFMPNARLVNVTLTEMIIQLPTQYAHNGQFTQFFKHIDADGDESPGSVCEEVRKLGITAYGLSDTSLEEIFLELADDPADHQIDNTTDSQAPESFNEATGLSQTSYFGRRRAQLDAIRMSVRMSKFTDDGKLPLPATRRSLTNRSHVYPQTAGNLSTESVSGDHQSLTYSLHVSVAQQLKAMFHKRFHHFKRYKRGWAIEFLLPVTLIILALLFVSFVAQPHSNPPMPIHPWLMTARGHKLHMFYENRMYATGDPYLNSSELQTIRHVASNYEKALTMPYSFTGTRCIPPNVYQIIPKDMASCEHRTKPPTWNPPDQLSVVEQDVARNSSLVQCSCDEGPQQCPADAIRPNPPPTVELQTTDILYNLTAYNVTDYLLKTRDLFINRRFGGISFIAASNPLARSSLETLLNPQNPVYSLLGSLTPISSSTPDPFWSQAADALRLMLPPTHHLQIWFDNKGYVSAPAYLNMLQNMQLRMLLANGTSSDTLEKHRSAGIAIVNHPVELPPNVAIARSSRTLMLDVTLAIFTILALSFIPASFITFLVIERHTGSKHLQFVSGLNAYVYWISVYLWDIMNYLIPAGLCILVFVAFQKYAYVGTDTIGPFILLIFLYGLAVLPMLYPFSFVIRSPSTALIALVAVNVLFGALTVMVTFFLDTISQENPKLAPVGDLLKTVFLVVPQYCLGRGLFDLAFREFILRFRHTGLIDVAEYENPLGWKVLGQKLLALLLQTVVFLTLVLLIQHRFFRGPIKRYLYTRYPLLAKRTLLQIQKKITKLTSGEALTAEDVQSEQRRVFELKESNSLASTSSVSTLRLTKYFRRKKIPSVNQLTFAIHPAECFGLLGVNGAGKTTTFHMLTGSLKPTFGVAYVNGYNVVDQQRQAHRSLGFCPQFDALLDLLTGRETLTLYARLRGVPEQCIPQTVTTLLTDMGLIPHADKVAGAYSGGNRRKLSTAIAILGDPQVIFLDEPTSGMDPLAKRFLWDQIIRLIKSGKSVLLTSHSMEECEALCDRLGIMVNGQFRCLGSVQQLKNRFGSGYTAELRISESLEAADQVRRILQNEFPQVNVNNTQTKYYEYQFPQRMQLAHLFATLNRLRTDGLIEQYSVKQTTLDQVFVNFSQMQMDHLGMSDEDTSTLTRLDGNAGSLAVPSTASLRQKCTDGVTNSSYEAEF